MGTEAPRSERVRPGPGLPPHRWTRVEDPTAEAVVARFDTVIGGGGPAKPAAVPSKGAKPAGGSASVPPDSRAKIKALVAIVVIALAGLLIARSLGYFEGPPQVGSGRELQPLTPEQQAEHERIIREQSPPNTRTPQPPAGSS